MSKVRTDVWMGVKDEEGNVGMWNTCDDMNMNGGDLLGELTHCDCLSKQEKDYIYNKDDWAGIRIIGGVNLGGTVLESYGLTPSGFRGMSELKNPNIERLGRDRGYSFDIVDGPLTEGKDSYRSTVIYACSLSPEFLWHMFEKHIFVQEYFRYFWSADNLFLGLDLFTPLEIRNAAPEGKKILSDANPEFYNDVNRYKREYVEIVTLPGIGSKNNGFSYMSTIKDYLLKLFMGAIMEYYEYNRWDSFDRERFMTSYMNARYRISEDIMEKKSLYTNTVAAYDRASNELKREKEPQSNIGEEEILESLGQGSEGKTERLDNDVRVNQGGQSKKHSQAVNQGR